MKPYLKIAACLSLFVCGVQADAHHSTANYDYTKSVELNGVLKKFQWTNPHCFLQVVVPDGKGGEVEWSIESGSPALARRLGWAPEMFKTGEKIKVVIAPNRNGERDGTLKSVTLANGKTLYGPGNQGQLPDGLGLPTLERAKK